MIWRECLVLYGDVCLGSRVVHACTIMACSTQSFWANAYIHTWHHDHGTHARTHTRARTHSINILPTHTQTHPCYKHTCTNKVTCTVHEAITHISSSASIWYYHSVTQGVRPTVTFEPRGMCARFLHETVVNRKIKIEKILKLKFFCSKNITPGALT